MASSKISELVDGTNFEPGDATIIVRNGANFKVDPTINAVNAWVNFNGTGTVAINASYNVSSITDNGTGDYTVNFTNAMTDANYSVTHGAQITGGNGYYHWYTGINSTDVRLGFITSGNVYSDPPSISVTIVR